MIRCDSTQVAVIGNGVTVLSEYTMITNALIEQFENKGMSHEETVEILKECVDMAATPLEELEKNSNDLLDKMTEEERENLLRDFIQDIMKGKK